MERNNGANTKIQETMWDGFGVRGNFGRNSIEYRRESESCGLKWFNQKVCGDWSILVRQETLAFKYRNIYFFECIQHFQQLHEHFESTESSSRFKFE